MLTSGVPEEGQEEASELQPAGKHARHSEPGKRLVLHLAGQLRGCALTAECGSPAPVPKALKPCT